MKKGAAKKAAFFIAKISQKGRCLYVSCYFRRNAVDRVFFDA